MEYYQNLTQQKKVLDILKERNGDPITTNNLFDEIYKGIRKPKTNRSIAKFIQRLRKKGNNISSLRTRGYWIGDKFPTVEERFLIELRSNNFISSKKLRNILDSEYQYIYRTKRTYIGSIISRLRKKGYNIIYNLRQKGYYLYE